MDFRNRQSFQREGDAFDQTFNWLFRIAIAVIITVIIGQLVFYASAVAVLYHFIAKFW